MKEIINESGEEYIKIPRKEYTSDEKTWFFMSLLAMLIGFIGGLMFGGMV